MFKIRIFKTKRLSAAADLKLVLNFGNLDFEFVSDFDPPPAGMDRNPALLGRISNLT